MKKFFLLFLLFLPFCFGGCSQTSVWKIRVLDGEAEIIQYVGRGKEVDVPSEYKGTPVTRIGSYAFLNSPVSKVNIPESIKIVGENAFSNCRDLVSINLGNIEEIGADAFSFCVSLTDVLLPKTVTRIDGSSFDGCTQLQSIYVDKDNPFFYTNDSILFSKEGELILYPEAKEGDSYIIPSNVKTIGPYAFSGNPYISSIIMQDNVREIGAYAFYSCGQLGNIIFSKKLEQLGDFALMDTLWLKENNNEIVVLNETFFIAYQGTENELIIPDGVKEITVQQQYQNLETVNKLILPASVLFISDELWNYSNITLFSVDSLNPNYTVIDGVILLSKDLSTLIRYNSTHSHDIPTLPESVTEIGNGAFMHGKLESFECPDSIKKIGSKAFTHSALKQLTLSKNLQSIAADAFANCNNLGEVVLPMNINSLGDRCFANCKTLERLTIPESVNEIGSDLFGTNKKVKIVCDKNSYAYLYAKENQYNTILLNS